MGLFKRKKEAREELEIEEKTISSIEAYEESISDVANTQTGEVSLEKLNVSIFTPQEYQEIKQATIHIKNGHPTVLNLKELETTEAKDALYFISGLLFAINGSHIKISKKIFLIMPKKLKESIIDEIQEKIIEDSLINN